MSRSYLDWEQEQKPKDWILKKRFWKRILNLKQIETLLSEFMNKTILEDSKKCVKGIAFFTVMLELHIEKGLNADHMVDEINKFKQKFYNLIVVK